MTLPIGIHTVSAEQYHADQLTDQPTLSRSGIMRLLDGTPAEYAASSKRLTQWPELLPESTPSMELGDVVHAMVLGDGCKFVVGDHADFMKKDGTPYETWSGDAKKWKQREEAAGNIVIDRETNAKALTIAEKLTDALRARWGKRWDQRKVEQTLLWKRTLNDGTEIYCRARPDAILPDGTIIDPKTTALSPSDASLGKMIAANGYDVQACHYQDGLAELNVQAKTAPEMISFASMVRKPPFILAFVQTVPPFGVRFVDLASIGWPLNVTRMRIDKAAHIFGECVRTGVWPDWPIDASPIPPSWFVAMTEAQVGMDIEVSE